MKVTLNGEFEFEPLRCPVTGISVWMGCRGACCRPDLHVVNTTAAVVQTAFTWPLINVTGTNTWPLPTTYTIGAGQ